MEASQDLFMKRSHKAKNSPISRDFDVVIEQDLDGYYVAWVPALPGCHTQARSLDTLMTRVREAIELCLEVQSVPLEKVNFVGVQRVSVSL